mgnify:CR=1 FL=1
MKRILALILILTAVFTLFACGMYDVDGQKVDINLPQAPINGIFDAPEEFYLEWDIPSIRNASTKKDGYYSMPVFRFDTYEELLHLKEIVGMVKIGNEIDNTDYCATCKSDATCSHDEYNEAFFENYTLLIGWHQYAGVVIPEHVEEGTEGEGEAKNVARYTFAYSGSLEVNLIGVESDAEETAGQWILVAVPKTLLSGHRNVSFFVKLPTQEELPNEEIPEE